MHNYIERFLNSRDDQFNYKPVRIAGDDLLLITPRDMSTKWTEVNEAFRSNIINPSTYTSVSLGMKKFCNFGERPDFQPWNSSWKFETIHKIDGSLLIISKYKNELIIRTRGTVDARQLPNGAEIDVLIEKYPLVFSLNTLKEGFTYLYEWTTPSNIIVIREHDTPTLTLLGVVENKSGRYALNEFLDIAAVNFGVERPERYTYSSVEECILDVDAWRGKEGVVLYSPDGQTLKKIKASEYCELHKIATGMKSPKQIMDAFIASPRFSSNEGFYQYIETTLDYEIAERIKDDIPQIVEAYNNYTTKLNELLEHIEQLKFCETRKEQALIIIQRYWDWRKSFAFLLLDNREIDDTLESDALHQELNLILKKDQ